MKQSSALRSLAVGSALVAVIALAGCANAFQSDASAAGGDVIARKKAASGNFAAAREEFFGLVDGASGRSAPAAAAADATEDMSLADRIVAVAWTAYYTGDSAALEKILADNGLYDQALALAQKYGLAASQAVLAQPSGATGEAARAIGYPVFDALLDGDVLLCYGGDSSTSGSLLGMIIPGHWKHAGIWDYERRGLSYAVLSASNATDAFVASPGGVLGRVGYETKEKWIGESAVAAMRVNGRSAANSRAAVVYGQQFVGKPFNFFVTRSTSDEFYCSKLVWRCWDAQGKDIEYNKWYYPRGYWVTPSDIYDDGDTAFVGGDSW